jgi:flagellar hook assembly protein FlgD
LSAAPRRSAVGAELARAAHARLEVYDIAGRRVAVLVDEPRPGGRHEVRWEGRDATGRQLASGVYYARLAAGEYRATQRMVLVK